MADLKKMYRDILKRSQVLDETMVELIEDESRINSRPEDGVPWNNLIIWARFREAYRVDYRKKGALNASGDHNGTTGDLSYDEALELFLKETERRWLEYEASQR